MPYSIGERGSYGCSGYPVVKDGTSDVMGCHETREAAGQQIAAIEASENKSYKDKDKKINKQYSVRSNYPGCEGFAVVEIDEDGEEDLEGCYETREQAEAAASMETVNEDESDLETNSENVIVSKSGHIEEGDYVMGMTSEGIAHGRVEHIMWEGGTLGETGTEYALESMPPENPAMSVRVYEQEDEGYWVPTAYSIGMMYEDAQKLPSLDNHNMPEEMEDEMLEMSKAESYSPTAGMKAAARRALKWKADGKATGAGTPVGWGRATDIVAGRSMSLSVVRRMFSFFSRHEVDKKGKDFNNTSNPSNGRIMWDAWGGDAGFSWSRGIVNRMRDKALFASFGKDFTKSVSLTEIFKSIGVGSMVSWNSSGGRAQGKITRIIRNGRYNVPGTEVTVTGSPEDPAAVIRLYRDGEPTDIVVAHKLSTLRQI
jgi:hypothetical protein